MSDDFTQNNRRLRIATPLGEDAMLITHLSGQEGVSTLFHFDVELMGRDSTVDFDAIVGKAVSIGIGTEEDQRIINGIVKPRYALLRAEGVGSSLIV